MAPQPTVPIPFTYNPLFQSPDLFIQAAGSDGSDGSAPGVHLRWSLLKNLAANQIPKGNLAQTPPYQTQAGFNKPNDFFKVYRTPYTKTYAALVDFTIVPNTITETGVFRQWVYTGFHPAPGSTTNVIIRFADTVQYDTIRATINPNQAANVQKFINAYTGILEVGATGTQEEVRTTVPGKFSFAITIFPKILQQPSALLQVEAVSLRDASNTSDAIISCRQSLNGADIKPLVKPGIRICSDNIELIRFTYSQVVPIKIQVETYEDYIIANNGNAATKPQWAFVGQFSLSIDDPTVYKQLEDTTRFTIDKKWPKFVGTKPSTGLFTVDVPNYKDRWIPASGDPGLKQAVIEYLTLSVSPTNLQANASLPVISSVANLAQFDMSYLIMLNLVAMQDYHAARMLGLGYIDNVGGQGAVSEYVYVVVYDTLIKVDPTSPDGPVTHLYMTQPTAQTDYRLPLAPEMLPITYGLTNNNGTSNPTQFTDANGYTLFADSRMIDLNKAPVTIPETLGVFFQDTTEYCLCDTTIPVAYGLKYKKNGEANYRAPELSSDDFYKDHSGVFEVSPILEQPNPFFVHQETEEGIHLYASYAINWFSRPSPLSNVVQTDDTEFPVRITLLPPANLALQLIQPETPLIFTTQAEQVLLAAIPPSKDKTLVRATFDWNYIQISQYHQPPNYLFGTQAEFFFKQSPPISALGQVASVIDMPNNTVQVTTQPYTINSTNPAQTIQPVILPADIGKYIGGLFIDNQEQFVIVNVIQPNANGFNPVFILQQIRQTSSQDPLGNNQFITVETYVSPSVGDNFQVVENMLNTANWDSELAATVKLINFTPTYVETVNEPDGTTKQVTMGGIFKPASIQNVYDPTPSLPPYTPTGVYTLTFTGNPLAPHPNPNVLWYKGLARIMEDPAFTPSPQMKILQVWDIAVVSGNLVLTVYDSTFDLTPPGPPSNGYIPIQTGNGINVNFHPSYKVYLYADTPNMFDQTTILPPAGQNMLLTYMAAQASDTTKTPVLNSALTPPTSLLARQIVVPLPPGKPQGPIFATRPDFYGKSTYTFDVLLDTTGNRRPYSIIFLRANSQKILDTLYKPTTVTAVIAALAALSPADAAFNNSRWNDLANSVIDATNNSFPAYITGGYRFPNPDNPLTAIPDPNHPSSIIYPFVSYSSMSALQPLLKIATTNTFIPLTKQPVVYSFLIYGTQTSSKAPIIRDANGDLIPPILPTDPSYNPDVYDPFPMAVNYQTNASGTYLPPTSPNLNKPTNKYYVRFTDYTLDGASLGTYFYFAVELANNLAVSANSPISGPVQLVNSYPAEAPAIKKVTTQLLDPINNIPTAVLFELNPIIDSEGIVSFNLYRSFDANSAHSTRTMTLATTISVSSPIQDTFSDLSYIPYGTPLFYRIVALRQIINEESLTELIPSQPSNLAMTNIVDVVNPTPPQLSYTSDPPIGTPVTLPNVVLSWSSTAYNATYYLYMMNSSGNWVLIYQIQSNASVITVALASTSLANGSLVKADANGNQLYYNFRVGVVNSSGLVNLIDNVLTI
jgi:hypothetical protein